MALSSIGLSSFDSGSFGSIPSSPDISVGSNDSSSSSPFGADSTKVNWSDAHEDGQSESGASGLLAGLKDNLGSSPSSSSATCDAGSYTVKQGDTLSQIAAQYHTSYEAIAKANGISNPDLILPGQQFKIPGNASGGSPLGDLGLNAAGGGGPVGCSPVGSIAKGDHGALIDKALQMAGVPVTDANRAAVNTIVQKESAWNPNAVNNWDSNAKAGHPSEGLMQTIPSTFKSYALPGYNTNIRDPLSNLIAGVRYSVGRYGSLSNVPGIKALSGGGRYVGY